MARGRRRIRDDFRPTVVEREPDEPELTDSDVEVLEMADRAKAELGNDEGYVMLSRRQPDGTLAALAKINMTLWSPEYVMRKYGGGRYVAKFFKAGVPVSAPGGTLGSAAFTIDPSVQPEREPVVAPDGRPVPAGEAGTTVFIAAALDKLSDAVRALQARPAVPAAPAVDPLDMIKAVGEAVKAMLPPHLLVPPAPAANGGSLKEQLALVSSIVDVGTKIVDARGGGGEPMESGDAYANVVAKLAEPVVELVKDRMEAERGKRLSGAPAQASLPARTGAAPASAPATPPPPEDTQVVPPWVMEVRRLLPLIASRAARGVSAENTAYFVLDDLSASAKEKIAELAALPDFETQLMRLLPPPLRQKPEWTGEFIAAVRDYFYPPEDEPDDEEEADDGDDTDDGDTGRLGGAEPPGAGRVDTTGAADTGVRSGRSDPLARRAAETLDALPAAGTPHVPAV